MHITSHIKASFARKDHFSDDTSVWKSPRRPRRGWNPIDISCSTTLMLMMLFVFAVFGSSSMASAQVDPIVASPPKMRSWTLWHRLLVTGTTRAPSSPEEWTVRGTIQLTDAAETEIAMETPHGVPESLIHEIQQVDGHRSNNNSTGSSWYQLKLIAAGAPDNDDGILTSVPACHIVRAHFRDELILHLQPVTAQALSLTYQPFLSPWAPASCAEVIVNTTAPQWESKISWDTAVPGLVVGQPPLIDPVTKQAKGGSMIKPPPGIQWSPGAIPKKSPGASTEAEANPADPFAFFKRYWYVFVPLLLMNLMAAGQPEAAAQGGAAPGSAAPPQRRGKKD